MPNRKLMIRNMSTSSLILLPRLTVCTGLWGLLRFSISRSTLLRRNTLLFSGLQILGLITSVRDGVNTTSLEYVICQKENHGPLILSEFSGTAGSLSDAIHVNPWDLSGVADAINKALTMPDDVRLEQHSKLYKRVISNDIPAWTDKYLSRFLTNLSSFDQSFCHTCTR